MSTVGKSTQLYSAFDPRSLGDCALWLDAADSSTLTLSGSNVTQWNDKSGTANHAVTSSRFGSLGPTVTTSNSLLFTRVANTSTQYLRTQTGRQTTQEVTFAMVVRYGNDNIGGVFLDMRKATDALAMVGIQGNAVFTRGSTSALQVFSYSFPTSFSIAIVQAKTNTYAAFVNGVSIASSTALLDMPSADTAYTTIGSATDVNYGVNATYANHINYTSSSEFREVLMFNSYLTSTQRQQLEGYLTRKWGVSSFQAPLSLGSPLSISGCSLWLDAADSNTLTLSGSNVTQWNDKSGNARNATVFNGTPTYTTSTGLTFNGSSTLQVTHPASPTTESLFLVIRFNSVAQQASILSGPTTGQREFLMYSPYSPGTIYLGRNGTAPSGSINGGTVTTGTTYLLEYVFNGTANTVSFYQSGTLATSGAPQFTYSAGGTTCYLGSYGSGGYLQGQIYELVVYNAALSTTQRQQVEGYLESKWGLTFSNVLTLPTTHPYRLAPPMLRSFTPLDVAGCALWLDAADAGTLTLSGSNVTTWADKSGNSRSATAISAATLSNNALVFAGSQSYNVSNSGSLFSGTSFGIFIVEQVASSPGAPIIMGESTGNYTTNNTLHIGYRNAGTLFFNYWNNSVDVSAGASSMRLWSLMLQTGSNRYLRQNGALGATGANSTQLASMTGLQIGTYSGVGSNDLYRGNLYEIIGYRGDVTNTDIQRIESYLARKWGFGSLPSSLSIGTPLTVPGCSLWLDAADSTTFTFSGGSNVSQWRDKSSNAFVASGSNLPGYSTTALNSRPGVTFNGSSQYFNLGNVLNLGSNQLYMFVVSKFNSTADGALFGKSLYGGAAGRYSLVRTGGAMTPLLQGGSASANNTGFADTSVASRILTMTWDRSTIQVFQNGTSALSIAFADSATLSNSYSTLIGAYQNDSGGVPPFGQYLNGTISEILLYLAPLTSTQRGQVESYLANKWGISMGTNLLPSAHLGRITPAMSVQFVPTILGNCALWLDAADPTSMTLSGTTVTQWRDKSGNSNHATVQTGSTTYSSNGVVFTGAQMFQTPLSAVVLNQSVFIVLSSSSNGGSMSVVTVKAAAVDNGYSCLVNSNQQSIFRFGGSAVMSGATIAQGTRYIYGATLSSGASSFVYANGTQSGSNTTTPTISGSGATVGIGGYYYTSVDPAPKGFFSGTINEILIYSNVLPTAQRQQVEGYLARKWGLSGPVPSLSIGTPLSISGCSLWLDAADSNTVTVSGSNITQWTDKSSNAYAFTPSGTAPKYGLNQINGKTVVTSQGNQPLRITNYSQNFSTSTFFCVIRPTQVFATWEYIGALMGSVQGAPYHYLENNGTNYSFAVTSYLNGATSGLVSATSPVGTTYLLLGTITGNTTTNFVNANGVRLAFVANTTNAGLSTTLSNATVRVCDGIAGQHAEFIQYNRILSVSEYQQIEAYLANKWGLSIAPSFSLPSSHPYKMTPLL